MSKNIFNKTKQFIVAFTLAGAMTAIAATGTYRVSVHEDSTVSGKQIKAGDYKVQVENNTATLKHGKDSITVPAHMEEAQSKFPNTTIRYVDNSISEIHVGGTNTRIVFGDKGPNSGAGGSN